MTRSFLLLFFYCLCKVTSITAAAVDTIVVRDLSHDWFFYHEGSDSYLPLVKNTRFDGNAIHFDVTANDYLNNQLRIRSKQPVSVFINNEIVDITKNRYYSLDSLRKTGSKEALHFVIYSTGLNPLGISTEILNISPGEETALAEGAVIIHARDSDPFQDFAIVAVLLLAAFLAALYNYFPKSVSDFYKVSKTFSLRESDENLFKTRGISRINLLFYIFLSFLIALVLILLINLLSIHLEANIFYPDSFWDFLWKWGQLAGIIACWIFFKYFLIYNLSALFYLRGFMFSHYFNYIRMTLFIFTTGLLIILLSYYGFEIMSPSYYNGLFSWILFFLGMRILILFFKLLSTATYKSLHLFSYLCGTEVIPFVILLYLGINQPF